MKKHIPNFLTSLNLFTGAAGTLIVYTGAIELAIYFVIICGIFDFLDGLMARLLHVKSAIGKELDSLADVISFGFLPGVVFYRLLSATNPEQEYLPFLGLLVVVFSALRLAKFNIDKTQTDKFLGLPTPANSIMIASITYLPSNWIPGLWDLIIVLIVSCGLLVSRIPLIALKFKGLAWRPNAFRYLLIITILIILAVLRIQGLPFIIPVYLLVSLIENFSSGNRV